MVPSMTDTYWDDVVIVTGPSDVMNSGLNLSNISINCPQAVLGSSSHNPHTISISVNLTLPERILLPATTIEAKQTIETTSEVVSSTLNAESSSAEKRERELRQALQQRKENQVSLDKTPQESQRNHKLPATPPYTSQGSTAASHEVGNDESSDAESEYSARQIDRHKRKRQDVSSSPEKQTEVKRSRTYRRAESNNWDNEIPSQPRKRANRKDSYESRIDRQLRSRSRSPRRSVIMTPPRNEPWSRNNSPARNSERGRSQVSKGLDSIENRSLKSRNSCSLSSRDSRSRSRARSIPASVDGGYDEDDQTMRYERSPSPVGATAKHSTPVTPGDLGVNRSQVDAETSGKNNASRLSNQPVTPISNYERNRFHAENLLDRITTNNNESPPGNPTLRCPFVHNKDGSDNHQFGKPHPGYDESKWAQVMKHLGQGKRVPKYLIITGVQFRSSQKTLSPTTSSNPPRTGPSSPTVERRSYYSAGTNSRASFQQSNIRPGPLNFAPSLQRHHGTSNPWQDGNLPANETGNFKRRRISSPGVGNFNPIKYQGETARYNNYQNGAFQRRDNGPGFGPNANRSHGSHESEYPMLHKRPDYSRTTSHQVRGRPKNTWDGYGNQNSFARKRSHDDAGL